MGFDSVGGNISTCVRNYSHKYVCEYTFYFKCINLYIDLYIVLFYMHSVYLTFPFVRLLFVFC